MHFIRVLKRVFLRRGISKIKQYTKNHTHNTNKVIYYIQKPRYKKKHKFKLRRGKETDGLICIFSCYSPLSTLKCDANVTYYYIDQLNYKPTTVIVVSSPVIPCLALTLSLLDFRHLYEQTSQMFDQIRSHQCRSDQRPQINNLHKNHSV